MVRSTQHASAHRHTECASSDKDSNTIHIYDGKGDGTPLHTVDKVHNHPVIVMGVSGCECHCQLGVAKPLWCAVQRAASLRRIRGLGWHGGVLGTRGPGVCPAKVAGIHAQD